MTGTRIALVALGSRGDVEPFAVLAHHLAARGHRVTLVVDKGLCDVYRGAGIDVVPLGQLSRDDHTAIVHHALSAPSPELRSHRASSAFVLERRGQLARRIAELDRGRFDLLVLPAGLTFPRVISRVRFELRWVTPIAVAIHTLAPPRDFRVPTHLPCLRLAGLSPLVMPEDPELRKAWVSGGFWVRRDPRPLSESLARFLDAGEPPLFLSMGSMVGFDGRRLVSVFVAAVRAAGARAIIQRGWAGLEAAPAADVCIVDEVDYATLFPRLRAVFAHGGTGTMAHALHAGTPIGLLPMVNDQHAWAGVLARLGNGLGSADPVTAPEQLYGAVERAMCEREPARAAAAIAAQLSTERGPTVACEAIEQSLARSRPLLGTGAAEPWP